MFILRMFLIISIIIIKTFPIDHILILGLVNILYSDKSIASLMLILEKNVKCQEHVPVSRKINYNSLIN